MAKNNNLGDFLTDIANAIRTKKGTSGLIPAQSFSSEILTIQSGGSGMTYEDYARTLYLAWGQSRIFPNAWQDSKEVDVSEIEKSSTSTTQYGKLQYPNGELFGVIIPSGTTSIGSSAFRNWSSNNQLLVIPDSVTRIGSSAFRNWSSNNQLLVILNSVTSIGGSAFYNWTSNNQPLVIPNSITSIAISAFDGWTSNNQPLVIPNSVTSIGGSAFREWSSNNQPLVIPNSVTSIGDSAFYNWSLVPYVEIQAITPPSLARSNAFDQQNNAPIYVPDASVNDYKTARNWVELASRIFPVSEKP